MPQCSAAMPFTALLHKNQLLRAIVKTSCYEEILDLYYFYMEMFGINIKQHSPCGINLY